MKLLHVLLAMTIAQPCFAVIENPNQDIVTGMQQNSLDNPQANQQNQEINNEGRERSRFEIARRMREIAENNKVVCVTSVCIYFFCASLFSVVLYKIVLGGI